MNDRNLIPIVDLFKNVNSDEEYQKEYRRLKPYYDLVLEIINLRNELGLTQKDLAERANTHQSRISKIESAEHDIRLSTLIQLAEAMQAEVCIRLIPIYEPIPVAASDFPYGHYGNSIVESRDPSSQFSEDEAVDQTVTLIY